MSKWFLVYNENVKIKFSCSNTVHKWQEKPRYCDLAGCFLKICNLRDVYLGERERVIYITLIVKISQYVAFSNYNLIKVFPYPRTTFQVLGITLTAKFYFQTFWLFFHPSYTGTCYWFHLGNIYVKTGCYLIKCCIVTVQWLTFGFLVFLLS